MRASLVALVITTVVMAVMVAVIWVFVWWNPTLASGVAFIGASRRFAAQHVEHLAGNNQPWAYHLLTFPVIRAVVFLVGCVLCLLGMLLPLAR